MEQKKEYSIMDDFIKKSIKDLIKNKKSHVKIGIFLYVITILISLFILYNMDIIIPNSYIHTNSYGGITTNLNFFSDGFIIARTLIIVFILNSLLQFSFYLIKTKIN